jgi:hypothetical protein
MNVAGGLCLGQEFMKGRGKKGRGAGLVFVFSLFQACWWAKRLPSGVQAEWVDASGSSPGQQRKGQSLDGGPGEPTLHRPLAIEPCSVELRRPEADAWGPTPAGGSKPSF